MKRITILVITLFTTLTTYSQALNLDGKWNFVKVITEKELDEEGLKMAGMLFEGMNLKFDSDKFEITMMGMV